MNITVSNTETATPTSGSGFEPALDALICDLIALHGDAQIGDCLAFSQPRYTAVRTRQAMEAATEAFGTFMRRWAAGVNGQIGFMGPKAAAEFNADPISGIEDMLAALTCRSR